MWNIITRLQKSLKINKVLNIMIPVAFRPVENVYNNIGVLFIKWPENGMTIEEFEFFGASKHTMDTFLDGYDEFIQIIRSRMINR